MKSKINGTKVYNLTTADYSIPIMSSIDNYLYYEHKWTAPYNIKRVLKTEIITIKE